MHPWIFLSPNEGILCVDCSIKLEKSFVAPQNILRKRKNTSHFVEKMNCECEPMWFVPIKQLLVMVDLAWKVVYYVSENLLDGV